MSDIKGYTMLPTKPQTIADLNPSPMHARIFLTGMPKVGKTTFASQWAPQTTLFIDLQHGTDLLPGEHYVQHVNTWTEFEQTVDLVAAGGHQFQTVIIDTVDQAYKLADAHAGAKFGQVAAGLVDWGKGTAGAEGVFRQAVGKLLACRNLGIWFLGHTDLVEVDKKQKYIPKLDKRVSSYIAGECEHIFLAERIGNRTVLHTQASQRYEVGTRLPLQSPMDMDARVLYRAMLEGIDTLAGRPQNGAVKTETESVEATA